MKRLRITIQLPEDLVAEVTALADEHSRSRSNMMEVLIKMGLQHIRRESAGKVER